MSAKKNSSGLLPRGLNRRQASQYIGIGTTKFDQLVMDGRMPPPKRIDGRKVWDRSALDLAFLDLPTGLAEASTESTR